MASFQYFNETTVPYTFVSVYRWDNEALARIHQKIFVDIRIFLQCTQTNSPWVAFDQVWSLTYKIALLYL